MRLGARETVAPELLPDFDEPDSPPLEPELELVVDPPEEPELDPDEPLELDEPDELPRGTACAAATAGAASTNETMRLSARRVDLGMVVSRGPGVEPPPPASTATLLPLGLAVNTRFPVT
jgi:hypothetical protein